MDEVDAPTWEKPAVEGARHSHHVVGHQQIPLLLLDLPLVLAQTPENVIEVVPGRSFKKNWISGGS